MMTIPNIWRNKKCLKPPTSDNLGPLSSFTSFTGHPMSSWNLALPGKSPSASLKVWLWSRSQDLVFMMQSSQAEGSWNPLESHLVSTYFVSHQLTESCHIDRFFEVLTLRCHQTWLGKWTIESSGTLRNLHSVRWLSSRVSDTRPGITHQIPWKTVIFPWLSYEFFYPRWSMYGIFTYI